MVYYCEVCDISIKPKSKQNEYKSKTHKPIDKCKHIKLTIENPYINIVEKASYEHLLKIMKNTTITLSKVVLNLFLMIMNI